MAEWRIFDGSQGPSISTAYSWSWTALSITDPELGDCHNGETNPQYLRAVRYGVIIWDHPDWDNGNSHRQFAASINDSGQVFIYNYERWDDSTTLYKRHIAFGRDNSSGNWNFVSNPFIGSGQPFWSFNFAFDSSVGPSSSLKCLDMGGLAGNAGDIVGGKELNKKAIFIMTAIIVIGLDGNISIQSQDIDKTVQPQSITDPIIPRSVIIEKVIERYTSTSDFRIVDVRLLYREEAMRALGVIENYETAREGEDTPIKRDSFVWIVAIETNEVASYPVFSEGSVTYAGVTLIYDALEDDLISVASFSDPDQDATLGRLRAIPSREEELGL